MLPYCLKYQKNPEPPKIVKTKNRRIILIPKCAVCNSKKSTFIKQQEATRLLSKLKGLLTNLTGVIILILSDLPILNT